MGIQDESRHGYQRCGRAFHRASETHRLSHRLQGKVAQDSATGRSRRHGMAGVVPMIDKVSRMNVLDTVRICHERDWDMLLTLDGGERGGKSSLGAEIVCIVEPKIEEDIRCGIYGSFFERYSWDWGSWHDLLKASHRRIVLREESDFLGRESMTDINRKILRILSTVGRRNNYMVLLFPDFWDLDLYAHKQTQIRGYVHARNIDKLDTEGPTRGFVNWYVRA